MNISTPKMLRDWIKVLSNKVEELSHINEQKDQIIEQQKAQIRRLQGLPAKPVFDSKDKTSELSDSDDDDDDDTPENKMKRRRQAAAKKSRRKKKDLKIDEAKKICVDPDDIDSTFSYKGTRKVLIQDLLFKRNNIEFELEKYYSSKYNKTV